MKAENFPTVSKLMKEHLKWSQALKNARNELIDIYLGSMSVRMDENVNAIITSRVETKLRSIERKLMDLGVEVPR